MILRGGQFPLLGDLQDLKYFEVGVVEDDMVKHAIVLFGVASGHSGGVLAVVVDGFLVGAFESFDEGEQLLFVDQLLQVRLD